MSTLAFEAMVFARTAHALLDAMVLAHPRLREMAYSQAKEPPHDNR